MIVAVVDFFPRILLRSHACIDPFAILWAQIARPSCWLDHRENTSRLVQLLGRSRDEFPQHPGTSCPHRPGLLQYSYGLWTFFIHVRLAPLYIWHMRTYAANISECIQIVWTLLWGPQLGHQNRCLGLVLKMLVVVVVGGGGGGGGGGVVVVVVVDVVASCCYCCCDGGRPVEKCFLHVLFGCSIEEGDKFVQCNHVMLFWRERK